MSAQEETAQQSSSAAAQSYDQIAKLRANDLSSKTTPFRNFNNFVKNTLIQAALSEVHRAVETQLKNGGETDAPSLSTTPDGKYAMRVLDLGSGRGGDLGKWVYAQYPLHYSKGNEAVPPRSDANGDAPVTVKVPDVVCGTYTCFDVSPQSISEAERRYTEGSYPAHCRCSFTVADCYGDVFLSETLPSTAGFGQFDCVSIQFALHYGCGSEDRMRAVLRGVAGALRTGGILIATIVDDSELARRVKSNTLSNSLFTIRFHSRSGDDEASLDKFEEDSKSLIDPSTGLLPVGTQYHFQLSGFVDCSEYIVSYQTLLRLAVELGLEEVPAHCVPFTSYLSRYSRRRNSLSLSAEEKELCMLYRAVCLRKRD